MKVVDLEQRRRSRAHPRIENVAQAVAQQVEAEHRRHQRQAGEEPTSHHSPVEMKRRAFRDHDAPFGRRRLDAEADEGQAGRVE